MYNRKNLPLRGMLCDGSFFGCLETKRRHMVEQDFLQLVQIAEQQQKRIEQLEQTTQVLISSNKQLIDWVDGIEKEMEDYKSNAPFELLTDQSKSGYWYPTVCSAEDTIELIINEGKSLARFGDGEFSAIAGRVRHRFQSEVDEKLGQRLRQVLGAEEPNLLLGIANNYGSLDAYTDQAKREIRRYLQRVVRKEHLDLLKPERIYYDAYVTRPYVMYADNRTDAPAARFLKLKQIWGQRDIVIVEGRQTKAGQGNDLLDNAKSVERVLGPAENAFREYDKILKKCLCFDKDKLFLLALGPTATVLAYDLCKAGYQAIDIGHLDLEYEWFLRGEGKRVEVAGKYNNELPIK